MNKFFTIQTASSSSSPRGFSLIEVVLALGIVTFCLVALLGLFSVGITENQTSNEELQASHLAESLLATLRANPLKSELAIPSLDQSTSIPKTVLVDGGGKVAKKPEEARFGLTYQITPPDDSHRNAALLYFVLHWPAHAPLAQAQGKYELTALFPMNK